MPDPTRRRVLGTATGLAAVGLGATVASGQEETDGSNASEDDEYWTVTADSADRVLTSNTEETVFADGDVFVGGSATVAGDVVATGHVILDEGTGISGDITANGAVVADAGVEISGDISTGRDALLGVDRAQNRAAYDEDALSGIEDISLTSNVVLDGNVVAAGALCVGTDSAVTGDVTANGATRIGSGTDVDGNITSAMTIVFEGDIRVTGSVVAIGGQQGEYTTVDEDGEN